MSRRSPETVVGNRRLSSFDVCIIGSGAGGSAAAHALAQARRSVLVLEAGANRFVGLDASEPGAVVSLHANDEVKERRGFMEPGAFLDPRTFRSDAAAAAEVSEDVNAIPKTVGGGAVHADMKYPRFNEVDFRLRSALNARPPDIEQPLTGTSFADWPLEYAELEPFYGLAETLSGVQGGPVEVDADGVTAVLDDPFASFRTTPYPMPPGVPMYAGLLLARAALRHGYHPFAFPAAITSRPYDGRPPCVDCGYCSGYGCPSHAKGSPAVTTLRMALRSGRCQLRANAVVTRLVRSPAGGAIAAAEYLDGRGRLQRARADVFVLAAGAIESPRLCLLSDPGGAGLGNASGRVGCYYMAHHQPQVVGIVAQRIHGHRGRAVTHGMADFRGVNDGGTAIAGVLGGVIEFQAGPPEPISEAAIYSVDLPVAGPGRRLGLKGIMRSGPFRDHLVALGMQAEDAPYAHNRVDLDPAVRDVYGLPAARLTYRTGAFEAAAHAAYAPRMLEIMRETGARFGFIVPPLGGPPTTRHSLGTLRMGTDPAVSVTDRYGKFHDLDNLYCCDGSLFPTSSGYNPTLTIIAMALRTGNHIASVL
jgi:gluconate 2-dehydrogenase alpha chain